MPDIPYDELKASVTLSAVVGETVRLRREGQEFVGLCPFHAEKTPSFKVNDKKRFFHCFGCGARGDVFDWLQRQRGMTAEEAASHLGYANGHANGSTNGHAKHETASEWRSFKPPASAASPDLSGFDAWYAYTDPDGNLVRYIARNDENGTERKKFVPFTWGELDGIEGWHRRQSNPPRELYGLLRLTRKPGATVMVCEGEKAADAAQALFPAYACVTWSGGTNSVSGSRWDALKDRDVILWPDNDEPGQKAASELSKILKPFARSIRQIDVTTLPPKGDAADLETDAPDEWLRTRLPGARIMTAAAFMADFVPPDYVIDGIIQRGRLYALTSPTGHGKTAVALYLACLIAAGRDLGAIEVMQGAVVFLAGENPDDLRCRMYAACQSYGLRPEALPFYVLPATFPLDDETAGTLKQEIDALGQNPLLIVVDTAAAFFPGDDDNQNVQMGAYARNLRVLTTCRGSPAVLTPAHPVKNPDRENLLPRGGGAFLNELDGNLTLWSYSIGEAAILHWQGKIRGPDFPPVSFGLHQVKAAGLTDRKGRAIMSIVARLQTDEQAEKAAGEAISEQNIVLGLLRRYPGISIRNIADNAGWMSDSGVAQKSKVHRLLKALQTDKLAAQRRGKWEITDLGRKELQPKKNEDDNNP
jgi:5S rRNA maturation endonuclease (ribonuclease M5)